MMISLQKLFDVTVMDAYLTNFIKRFLLGNYFPNSLF